ncbi:MAG: class I SAM-dependent methyltransferase, partial [Ktedonobacteraceae bacterium]
MHRYEERNNYIFDVHDERELARLQLLDNLFNETLDMLPQQFMHDHQHARILDVACGPGGWALQIAHAHTEWSVIGVDISLKMIEYARAQAEARKLNVQFRLMDALKFPWSFPDRYFDLVNIRFITGFAPVVSLPTFYQECWRALQPGGIIRSTEVVCMSAPNSPAVAQLTRKTFAAMWKAGLIFSPTDMSVSAVLAHLLKDIGFENITLTPFLLDLSHGAPMHQPMWETLKMSAD